MISFAKKYLITFLLLGSSSIMATPKQVIIIRHGEKALDSNQLNTQGFERAGALAPFFQQDPSVTQYGVADYIFAQKAKSKNSSIRPIQTVTPLAQLLGLKVNTPYTRDEYASLANLILTKSTYDGQVIVISWAHQAISGMAAAFGAVNPPVYPEDRFDLLYMLTYDDNGNVSFCVGLQELMYGDQSTLPGPEFPPCS